MNPSENYVVMVVRDYPARNVLRDTYLLLSSEEPPNIKRQIPALGLVDRRPYWQPERTKKERRQFRPRGCGMKGHAGCGRRTG